MSFRPIRSGSLRHVMALQSRGTRSRGAQGGFTYPAWVTLRTIHCRINPKSGRETFFADQIRADATHFITTRVQSDSITPDMRLTYDDRVFNILQALTDELRHEVTIAAVETLGVAEDATGTVNLVTTYQTDEIDFTQTQSITKSIPTGRRFYPDSFEIICTVAGGTPSTQPTCTLGITGSTAKYATKTPTLLTAANKRQGYSGLSANDGETSMVLSITGAGAISAGNYKGRLLVKGVLE